MKTRGMLATLALAAAAAAPLAAQEKPIQLALFTPVQIVPANEGVSAVRLTLIYSANTSVKYFDWGLVATTTGGPSAGVQWAFVSINKGPFTGWQASAVAITQNAFTGLQTGWFTSARKGEGLQWGIVNTANYWNGLQLGLVNYAQQLHGVQIGLVNIIKTGGQFPVFPIINWSF